MHAEIIQDADEWNHFVEASHTGNITQTFEWGDVARSVGSEVIRLGVRDGADLVGVLQALVTPAPLLRRPYLYVPRGPVIDNPRHDALQALFDRAQAEARAFRAFMLKVEPNVPTEDTDWLSILADMGFRRNPFATHPRRSWVLDISPPEQEILAGMKEKWRYNIRLATRKGVTVRESTSPSDVTIFYALYQETAARDGFFIHPESHYQQILRFYGKRDAAVLLLAEYEGSAIAGLIAVRCGPVTTYMFGASSNQHRNRMPNHLLQWTAIQWARHHGCSVYDFRAIAERLAPDEDLYSLYTYKQGFGGHSSLVIPTHDLPISLPMYWAYMQSLRLKRALDRRRHLRQLATRRPSSSA